MFVKGCVAQMSDKELLQWTRDYFAQVSKIDRLIQRLRHSIGKTQSTLPNRSSALFAGADPDEQVVSRIDELAAMRNEAFAMIGNVPDFDQQNILVARYIQLKKWDDIADELEFSVKWVLKLHARGIRVFAKINQDFLMEWQKRLLKAEGAIEWPAASLNTG